MSWNFSVAALWSDNTAHPRYPPETRALSSQLRPGRQSLWKPLSEVTELCPQGPRFPNTTCGVQREPGVSRDTNAGRRATDGERLPGTAAAFDGTFRRAVQPRTRGKSRCEQGGLPGDEAAAPALTTRTVTLAAFAFFAARPSCRYRPRSEGGQGPGPRPRQQRRRSSARAAGELGEQSPGHPHSPPPSVPPLPVTAAAASPATSPRPFPPHLLPPARAGAPLPPRPRRPLPPSHAAAD